MEIYDNLVPEDYFLRMQHLMVNGAGAVDSKGNFFEWMWSANKARGQEEEHPYNFQFVHMFYGGSDYEFRVISRHWDMIIPMLDHFKARTLFRVKANLTTRTPERFTYSMHKDVNLPKDVPFKTAIFYLNTNDGKTIFEDTGEEIDSVANRLLVFDGHRRHAGTSSTDVKNRVVINFNFI